MTPTTIRLRTSRVLAITALILAAVIGTAGYLEQSIRLANVAAALALGAGSAVFFTWLARTLAELEREDLVRRRAVVFVCACCHRGVPREALNPMAQSFGQQICRTCAIDARPRAHDFNGAA
jgi:hypothetical protein